MTDVTNDLADLRTTDATITSEPEYLLEQMHRYTLLFKSGASMELDVMPEDVLTFDEVTRNLVIVKAETPGPFGPTAHTHTVNMTEVASQQVQSTWNRKRNPKYAQPAARAQAPTAILGGAPR